LHFVDKAGTEPAGVSVIERPRRFAVIGCSGFIGSHLLERLVETQGIAIRGFDLDVSKITHLLNQQRSPLEVRKTSIADAVADGSMRDLVDWADVVINLAAICTPYDYTTRPVAVIRSSLFDALPIVDLCAEHGKWLVQFSTCEVYGRTMSSYFPGENYTNPDLFVQSEASTPLVMGPVQNQRWSYASAKQTLERYVYAMGYEHQLPFTIVRPFNFFGPRMDFLPGYDGSGTPRVLASFMKGLIDGIPLQLVDGGNARRTITSIHDAIDAMMLMFESPHRAVMEIFNIGAVANELTIRDLAFRMRDIYAEVSGLESMRRHPIVDVSHEEYYGKGGYEDCDRRVVDASKAEDLLGWHPKFGIDEILREVIAYYYLHYAVGPRMTQSL
jgi:UDP-apiose/xylose synthase